MLGESVGHSKGKFLLLLVSLVVASCAPKSKTDEANGDVAVQIATPTSATEYSVQVVTLKGIKNLKEVAGAFVKFFYAPGANEQGLTGSAPRAHFTKASSFFVPTDLVSMQMATIYFHMQNLAELDIFVGAGGINTWPRSVGVETQIDGNYYMSRNNAFYNGQTDAMMFVPFTLGDLPISLNAGIIAHEHFHSLFYKLVIKPAVAKNIPITNSASIHAETATTDDKVIKIQSQLSEDERAHYFNDTLLRGQNEGLADFWGWLYTSDANFIRWSLPSVESDRTLTLSESDVGDYFTKEKLNEAVTTSQAKRNPENYLASFAYYIGTSHARFLKQLTTLQVDEKSMTLPQAQKAMGGVVVQYLKSLSKNVLSVQGADTLETRDFFNYFAQALQRSESGLKLNEKNCAFLIKYLNKESSASQKKVCSAGEGGQVTIQGAL